MARQAASSRRARPPTNPQGGHAAASPPDADLAGILRVFTYGERDRAGLVRS